jgi:hypothetical protein
MTTGVASVSPVGVATEDELRLLARAFPGPRLPRLEVRGPDGWHVVGPDNIDAICAQCAIKGC